MIFTSPLSAAPARVLVIDKLVLVGSAVKPHQLADVEAAPITVHEQEGAEENPVIVPVVRPTLAPLATDSQLPD